MSLLLMLLLTMLVLSSDVESFCISGVTLHSTSCQAAEVTWSFTIVSSCNISARFPSSISSTSKWLLKSFSRDLLLLLCAGELMLDWLILCKWLVEVMTIFRLLFPLVFLRYLASDFRIVTVPAVLTFSIASDWSSWWIIILWHKFLLFSLELDLLFLLHAANLHFNWSFRE